MFHDIPLQTLTLRNIYLKKYAILEKCKMERQEETREEVARRLPRLGGKECTKGELIERPIEFIDGKQK